MNKLEAAVNSICGVHPDWSKLECFRVGFKEGAEWQSKQSLWISVEEQYPKYEKDNKERYLVRVESGSMETKVSYNLGWLTSKYKFNVEMDWVRVTHWMPIPSFYNILEANKDVLKRIKEKGD